MTRELRIEPVFVLTCSLALVAVGLLGIADSLRAEPFMAELLERSSADRIIWPTLYIGIAVFGLCGVRLSAFRVRERGTGLEVLIWRPFGRRRYTQADIAFVRRQENDQGAAFTLHMRDGRKVHVVHGVMSGAGELLEYLLASGVEVQ
jgi:hypothetical protein